MFILGGYQQYMFEFWLRFDACDIFWFEVSNFFEFIFGIVILCQKSLIFGLSWAYFSSLDLQARVEFESKCSLCVFWHVSTFVNALCAAVGHCT